MDDIALIRQQKKALRKEMLENRNKMHISERKKRSGYICTQLWDMIKEKEIKVLHTFLPMGSEVLLFPLLKKAMEEKLMVVAPKTLKKRKLENLVVEDLKKMEAGIFGTYHPANAEDYQGEYDLIIVAGLAFDSQNYRLGYGGGYYDTFLKNQKGALKIGVGFTFQLVDAVPLEAHDIQLDGLILG